MWNPIKSLRRLLQYLTARDEEGDIENLLPTLPKAPRISYFLSEEAIKRGVVHPHRAYEGDAGLDLRVMSDEAIVIPPHERRAVPTGVGFDIPDGWYGLICNRTSWGRRGLIPLAQVVDSSFTGFLTLTLHNTNDDTPLTLEPGERVAQIVFMPVWHVLIERIDHDQVANTGRGVGAYGSSGR